MAKTPRRKPARSPIALAGEKTVKPTPATDGVKPLKLSKAAKQPMPDRAIDRRNNIEPGGPVGDGAS